MSLTCKFYKLFIDPLLYKLRSKVSSLIPEECSIIEIGSGTGAQSLLLAKTASKVVGIDINKKMTSCAANKAKKLKLDNIKYFATDGSNLNFISDKEFDYSTITLALHELKDELRFQIIKEMKRISKHIIIVDYNTPLPNNFSGWVSKKIEKLAGGSHYAGFKNYTERGGILKIINEMGLTVEKQYSALNSAIIILEVNT